MTAEIDRFPRAVSLACHDLRTPLATIAGFAKTMVRAGRLPEREQQYTTMIDAAAGQLGAIVDQLALAARIADGRYEPVLDEVDTLELAGSPDDDRIGAAGSGATITTDVVLVRRSLGALAAAALRHGETGTVMWSVAGRELILSPVTETAAPVVDGSSAKDLGALLARIVLEHLGGTLALEGDSLRVRI
jgi:signal transduction histidine kinase